MRVGLIIYDSLEPRSGGFLYDARLVETLLASGDEVDILAQPWQSYIFRLLQNEDHGFLDRLITGNYDLLLQDELNHPSLYKLNYALRKRTNTPIVSIVHHLRTSEKTSQLILPIMRKIEKKYLKSVTHFIFNSQTTMHEVTALLGSEPDGMVAYPGKNLLNGGLPPEEIYDRCHRLHPTRLIFAGNLISRKGLVAALHALAGVKDLTWTFDIIGDQKADPRHVNVLKGLVMDLGLNDRVSFQGRMEPERLSEMFKQSQILLSPAQYEGFGITFVEAMGCGLPVIALNTGAAPEVIADGETGILVSPGDTEGLAEAIRRLIGERGLLEKMSLAARARFEKFPTWDESMEDIRSQLLRWKQNAD